MARRRKKAALGSLDSLLDTMTNVVGILVILLTVTQLGVSDAIRRIQGFERAIPAIEPEKVERAEREADELARRLADLRAQWDRLGPQAEQDRQAAVDLQRRLARAKAPVSRPTSAPADPGQLETILAKRKARLAELTKQYQTLSAALAALKARLDQTPEHKAPPAKVIRLPDPRPAPKGATPMIFLCREGKVVHVDVDALRDRALRRTRYFLKTQRQNPKALDGKALVNFFDRQPLGDRNILLRIRIIRYRPYLVFERKPGAGETPDRLAHRLSEYQRMLRVATMQNHYARYIVWPDSYEAYLTARQLAQDAGVAAGWEPTTAQGEWRMLLSRELLCAGRPKPKPKPKPTTPPKPKPATPRPPPLPKAEID